MFLASEMRLKTKPKEDNYHFQTNHHFLDVWNRWRFLFREMAGFWGTLGEVGHHHEPIKINIATVTRECCSNCFKFHIAVLKVS